VALILLFRVPLTAFSELRSKGLFAFIIQKAGKALSLRVLERNDIAKRMNGYESFYQS